MRILPSQPKDTFSNLPAAKRDRIAAVALEEFAAQGFRQASLNTMVKKLGIAKGSLYQYFRNKEAIFLFIFESFVRLVKEQVKAGIQETEAGDFFGYVRNILRSGIRFVREHPRYFQIYLQVLYEPDVPHREELVSKVRLFSAEFFGPLVLEAQSRKMIRNDVSPQMVVFMLDALLDRFLQGYARPYLDGGLALAGKDDQTLQHDIETVITILRDGLSP